MSSNDRYSLCIYTVYEKNNWLNKSTTLETSTRYIRIGKSLQTKNCGKKIVIGNHSFYMLRCTTVRYPTCPRVEVAEFNWFMRYEKCD